MPRPFILDMETSDPDDFLTLLLLLGHPEVDLRAVTVTPGTREQVGLVRWALARLGRDIPVGAFDATSPKRCVSEWHHQAYDLVPTEADPDGEGWKVLHDALGEDTTLVTGAPLKNVGRLLAEPERPLGRLFVQGGFAGEGVVPTERQLEKFRGRTTCPSFNLNGDPKSVFRVIAERRRFSDLRFVSKNVCHGVVYDAALHARVRVRPWRSARRRKLEAAPIGGWSAFEMSAAASSEPQWEGSGHDGREDGGHPGRGWPRPSAGCPLGGHSARRQAPRSPECPTGGRPGPGRVSPGAGCPPGLHQTRRTPAIARGSSRRLPAPHLGFPPGRR